MSMHDSTTTSAGNAVDNDYTTTTMMKRNDVSLDTSIQGNLDGTRSKLVQMSSMKLQESSDTIKDSSVLDVKGNDNSSEIKGDAMD